MALIDPEGLFDGDRFDLMSDEARLYWAHFWCASNSLGRIELNYHKVVARAFARFKNPPSQEKFWSLVREYHDAYLLFVYKSNGQAWGQWDTSERFLPRHKSAKDLKTPSPESAEYLKWRDEYISKKAQRFEHNINSINDFVKPSADLRGNVRGVGVGVGIGVGLKTSSKGAPQAQADEPIEAGSEFELTLFGDQEPAAPSKNGAHAKLTSLTVLQERWFEVEFWPHFWRKVDKQDAMRAFRKHATSEAKKDLIVRRMHEDTPAMLDRESEHRPYAATWLNKRRYTEQAEKREPGRAAKNGLYNVLETI